jgi:undecaprenyl-diphosphatase
LETIEYNMLVLVAIFLSFIFSYITVKYFLIYINKFSMNAFVIYRILISFLLFYIIY